ncbi:MAG: flagellar biosynthesis anti-sigma factor FlgM [Oscillospiraceae bacterium]|jgi:anti-sigma28 factor (negative regulator of flagellin synthesis)|nr:flagellar biosynthesis anti-sigma factor FlgM [Oscillospiraceae bacterium]
MKINVNPVTNRDMLVRYTAGRAKPRDEGAFSSGLDNVSFSEDALSFSKALTQARESIDTRTEEEFARAREVGLAVRRGEYSVDSGKIAERIVSGIWL